MALRVSFAVIISSIIQTRDQAYDPSHAYAKKWLFFPDWYYLGGLSYCAIMIIFSMAYNVGGTIREVCQGIAGVGMALAYNSVLFAVIQVKRFDNLADDPYKNYHKISKAFNSGAYWINVPNMYTTLPWIVLFTTVMMVLPFHINTRKYALGTNAYFTLTIINPANPANPLNPGQLKGIDEQLFATSNILRNLQVYAMVGVLGAFISVASMCVPYPIFAISRLRDNSQKAPSELLELLNLIVDLYCLKNNDVGSLKFFKRRLKQKFDDVEARHCHMMSLLDDAWWEQCFGLHYPLHFNWVMSRTYIRFIGSLIADLRTLCSSLRLDHNSSVHAVYMNVLMREIRIIQSHLNDLISDISSKVHALSPRKFHFGMYIEIRRLMLFFALDLELQSLNLLENEMDMVLCNFHQIQKQILKEKLVTFKDVEGNMPLSFFLFSLNSFCSTLVNFQDAYNSRKYDDRHRVRSFMRNSLKQFVNPNYYRNPLVWINAFKITAAIMLGVAFSVGVYGFSATVPSTIAYIMCETIGSSFRKTVNRVGGVVAGSVVPSVLKFFLVQMCDPIALSILLSNMVMFIWVTMCMYVYFGQGYGSYGGLVAAFVASDTLLRQTDICYPNGSDNTNSIAVASYSSLAQTSVAGVIFISVETLIFPRSAVSMLRYSIAESLHLHQKVFDVIFKYHLSSVMEMDEVSILDVRRVLMTKSPQFLERQRQLLAEAMIEPLLWRSNFSSEVYRRVLIISQDLLNNIYILFKLLRWVQSRVAQTQVLLDMTNCRDDRQEILTDNSCQGIFADIDNHIEWKNSATRLQFLVHETIEVLDLFFRDKPCQTELDQFAVHVPVSEANHSTDDIRCGELNDYGVSNMLEIRLPEFVVEKEEDSQNGRIYVDQGSFRQNVTNFVGHGLVYETGMVKVPRQFVSLRLGKHEIHDLGTDKNDEKVDEMKSSAVNSATIFSSNSSNQDCEICVDLNNSVIRRLHDILNSDGSSIIEAVTHMQSAYAKWLLTDKRYEHISMEKLLLFNCFISGAESIAKSLSDLEEVVFLS
ncbi:putative parvalbumin [Plasmopara halstedii]